MAVLICLQTGCVLPRTRVLKNPGEDFEGLRYYRPKPYLLIGPSEKNPKTVDIVLQYLPDYEEEYGIQIRSGLGINDTTVELVNGWQLKSLNAETDSQFAKNLTAITGLASAIPGNMDAEFAFEVKAQDVPFGYYESVIGVDGNGNRRMYGWRYVGFAPFAACPIEAHGGPECLHCGDPCQELWGLVAEGDSLSFKLLSVIASTPKVYPEAAAKTGDGQTRNGPLVPGLAYLPPVSRDEASLRVIEAAR